MAENYEGEAIGYPSEIILDTAESATPNYVVSVNGEQGAVIVTPGDSGNSVHYTVQTPTNPEKLIARTNIGVGEADTPTFVGTTLRSTASTVPAKITLDRQDVGAIKFTISHIGSTVDAGWTGMVMGFNLDTSANGTPSVVDGSRSGPYLQMEYEWDAGAGNPDYRVRALTGTFTTVGTAITASYANAFATSSNHGELRVGDAIKIGVTQRAIASITNSQTAVLSSALPADVTTQPGETGCYDITAGTISCGAGSFSATTSADLRPYLAVGGHVWIGSQSHTITAINATTITLLEAHVSASTNVTGQTGGLRMNELWWQGLPGSRVIFLAGSAQFPSDRSLTFSGPVTVTLASDNEMTPGARPMDLYGTSASPVPVSLRLSNLNTATPIVGIELVAEAGANPVKWNILANGAGTSAGSALVNTLYFINQNTNDYQMGLWPTGNTSIGLSVTQPDEKLHVGGNVKATGFIGSGASLTGVPISTGISGLGTGVATFLATPSSANLASAVTGETGSGSLVFNTDPTFAGTLSGMTGIDSSGQGLTIATGGDGLTITGSSLTVGSTTVSFTNAVNLGNGSSATASITSNLSGATDPTLVFSNNLITASGGIAAGTLALGGATIGSHALAVRGTIAADNNNNDTAHSFRSGGSTKYLYASLGRTADEFILGIAAASGQFFSTTGIFNAVASDGIFKGQTASVNRVLLGAGAGAATVVVDQPSVGTQFTGPVRAYNVSTSATNFERGNFVWASNVFNIGTEKGSGGGTARDMALQTDGTTRVTISAAGLLTIAAGSDIALATATGTKIATATNQLLGFYGVTPVDQPATVADPSGGGTQDAEARTAIAAIIDRLQELGLIA